MSQWDGLPPECTRGETRYHVIASALGRNPTVFRWEPKSKVWVQADRVTPIHPNDMKAQGLTYFGWVVAGTEVSP